MKKYTDNNSTNPLIEGVSNKLTVEIPFEILSSSELSLNEKLIFGLDFSLKSKLGFNQITSKDVGVLFNLHPNIVGDYRKSLLKKGYLTKEGRKYFLTDHYKTAEKSEEIQENKDRRNIKIPFEVYSNRALNKGEKLLWGEYNSISKGEKEYFASREYTANRLKVSVESISNWTKSLNEKGLFKKYEIVSGYYTHQRRIITCRFDKK
jgi:Mn-dependent DtxR family transcriptional regulator